MKVPKIETWVVYYASGKVHMIYHTLNGQLHHYFKPAMSIYRNDFNNTLCKEIFYYEGKLSKIQEGVSHKFYSIK